MDPPRSRAMVGSAMEISLAVTQTSAVTRQSPTRDHHRRSVWGCASWVGVTIVKAEITGCADPLIDDSH